MVIDKVARRARRGGSHQVAAVVAGHVVSLITTLVLHSDTQLLVVGCVAGPMPVLEQRHEKCRSLPPFIGESTRDLSSLVSVIVFHGRVDRRTCGILERVYSKLVTSRLRKQDEVHCAIL